MVWYYRDGDQETGPVSKADLQTLIKSKKIGPQTLVKSVEMDNWCPLIDVVSGKVAPPQSPPSPPPQPDPEPEMGTLDDLLDDDLDALTMEEKPEEIDLPEADGPGGQTAEGAQNSMAVAPTDENANTAICSQCGRFFPEDQVIAYDDQMICAACKPMFVQKLKEGATVAGTMNYGGFWIRFLAKFIDGIIMSISQWAIMIPVSMLVFPSMAGGGDQMPSTGFFVVIGLQVFIGIALPLAYSTFFLGRWGATLGKMACRLQVVTPEGGQITYMRAFGRFFAEMISYIILMIGYIMAGFDEEKRALHDRICSTRVVKKS